MKKLSIALVLLLTVGLVGAFAVDFEPVVDFSAEVTNTFGVDLNDDMSTGFDLSAEADLSVMFVDTTVEKGEGDVYGWIQVEDMELGLMADEGTDPGVIEDGDPDEADASGMLAASIGDINARVIFTPMYVQLSTAPGFSWDNAEQIRVDDTDDADPLPSYGTNDIHDTNAGIIVGADGLSDMIDVAFKIGSLYTYDKDYSTLDGTESADPANTDNWYAFGLDVTVTPAEMFSLDLGFVTSNADQTQREASMGLTVNPELTLDVMSGLVIGLPVDVTFFDADNAPNPVADDSISLDFAPMVTLDLNEGGSNVKAKAFGAMNTEVDPGNLWLDAMVGFEEVADGFVAGLTSYLNLYLFDILDTTDNDLEMGYGVDAGFSYDIDGIKPYVDMKYYVQDEVAAANPLIDSTYTLINEDGIGDEFLNLSAGVELALIENTVFDLNYSSVNLTSDVPADGVDKGRLTFATTVSY